ncbi:cytochrome P450 4V2-like [Thrips palmi]|uniref:Cytochrome P450 4V2-like n=1 Tax=Thrips palmi TaxID=161013 RepID=A0A6P8ZZ86_THRPL|nr:cytochrome P450 4V2-like [Thrips palmi]
MFWMARKIPGPPAGVLRMVGPTEDVFAKALAVQREYGNTVRFWAWPVVNVTISEPEDLEVFYTSPALQHKPAWICDMMKPILGEGLVTLDADDHRRHRRAISPSLHLEILQGFLPLFEQSARTLCAKMAVHADTGMSFDAQPMLGAYAAEAICQTVFSDEWEPELHAIRDKFVECQLQASRVMFYRVMRPWLAWDATFYFSSRHDEYYEAASVFETFVSTVLSHKMKQLERGVLGTPGKRRAFLDNVLTCPEGKQLTREELTEELKTMSGAAVGTSMDFLCTFLLVMSIKQDVQDRIARELDDVFGGSDRPIETADLPHLQYLECAIKESMRLFPPTFGISRQATQDVKLPSGHVLPAGCIVGTVPYFTHRLPRHFPDPEAFRPERFLPENSRGRHPYAYVPFSAGVRNCIGQRYALMSAKTATSTILRRFRVLPALMGPQRLEDIKFVVGISMAVHGGAPIRLERRR